MTPLRSMLFVPGDSERKQSRALASDADALILDLEDSVSPSQLPMARSRVRELLRARQEDETQQLWVRMNAPGSGQLLADMDAVVAARPDGIVVPKAGHADVIEMSYHLEHLEKCAGLRAGSIKLIVIAGETPRSLLTLDEYLSRDNPRLVGLTWGAEDLSAALGSSAKVDEAGAWTFTFQFARTQCLITAAAIEAQAIDTIYTAYRDIDGLRKVAAQARRDGFLGKLAIHPDQVEPINEAFTPSTAEVKRARRVVDIFEQSKAVGVATLDGHMIDRPQLMQARRVLSLAEKFSSDCSVR